MSIDRGLAPVECPRCHKLWMLPWASPGIQCDCHLFCTHGYKPDDCQMTYPVNFTGKLAWPLGEHLKPINLGDDVIHNMGYCELHHEYTTKVPVWLEVDWKTWESVKLTKPRHKLFKTG